MLLECLKGQPITVDGRAILQDVRINVAGNNQLRAKLTYIGSDNVLTSYDIVIYKYTVPKMELDTMSMSIFVKGEEYQRHIPVSFKLSYHFLQKKWKLSGDINLQPIDWTIKGTKDIPSIVGKFKKLFDIK